MTKIGFLSYRRVPQDALPPARMRAMLAEAALQGVTFGMLDPSDFDMSNGQILTHIWSPDGWKQEMQPLPDVAFINGDPLEPWQEPLDTWIRDTCRVIADEGGNKLELIGIMTGTTCEKYLIPGNKVPADRPADMLAKFLRAQGGAVVKRSDGNRGVGLFFIAPEGREWAARYDKKIFRGTLEEVAAHVASRIAGRLRYRDYVVQRYIRSVAGDGRATDIRVHVQRRAGGQWGVTRAYVRLAECGMPLANTSRGGYQGPLDGFLQQRKVRSAEEVEAEAKAAAIAIAETEDKVRSLPLSELGIDFLIDDSDRLWLIETNAYPGSYLHEHERAVHTIGYAKWLGKSDGLVPHRA